MSNKSEKENQPESKKELPDDNNQSKIDRKLSLRSKISKKSHELISGNRNSISKILEDQTNKNSVNAREINKTIQKNVLFELEMRIKYDSSEKVKCIEMLDYSIKPFFLNIDTSIINKIMEFSDNLTLELNTSFTSVEPIFLRQNIASRYNLNIINQNTSSSNGNNVNADFNNNLIKEEASNIYSINKPGAYMNNATKNNNIENNSSNNYPKNPYASNIKNQGRLIQSDQIIPFWMDPIYNTDVVSNKHFIERMLLSELEINFSFLSQGDSKVVFKRLLDANPVVTSIISSLTNLENVKIFLRAATLNNVYGDSSEIIQTIVYNYKQAALTQLVRVLGGMEIFGNPVNLMSNLGTGVKDFIKKPVEGLKQNVVQGAIGVAEGSVSLVKHTVQGTFSTAGKITSGISKGFLYITQDDEYIKRKQNQKMTRKPKNFVEGIGYGLSSMAGGFYHGVKDVFMKPIEGAKKEKWAGFGKGVLKGFAGVLIKPITGVLDLVSQTSEGIKNTLAKEAENNRERWPRVFYGRFKYVKN